LNVNRLRRNREMGKIHFRKFYRIVARRFLNFLKSFLPAHYFFVYEFSMMYSIALFFQHVCGVLLHFGLRLVKH